MENDDKAMEGSGVAPKRVSESGAQEFKRMETVMSVTNEMRSPDGPASNPSYDLEEVKPPLINTHPGI